VSQPLNFRTMTIDDLPVILRIEHKNFPNPWPEKTLRGCLEANYQCVIGFYDAQPKEVVCYAVLMIGFEESNLLNISVNPDFQQQGIGRRLMEHLLLISRINQAKNMWLEVRASNTPAIRLYQKLGFDQIGQRDNYYRYHDAEGKPVSEHAILMSRAVVMPVNKP